MTSTWASPQHPKMSSGIANKQFKGPLMNQWFNVYLNIAIFVFDKRLGAVAAEKLTNCD